MQKYVERHAFLLSKMEAETRLISNRARFIVENIEKKMTVMNRKKVDVIKTLKERGYDSDPVKAWKTKMAREKGIEFDKEKKSVS
jgi:DNA topoisomerase-2